MQIAPHFVWVRRGCGALERTADGFEGPHFITAHHNVIHFTDVPPSFVWHYKALHSPISLRTAAEGEKYARNALLRL
jgi:hypothetical protein